MANGTTTVNVASRIAAVGGRVHAAWTTAAWAGQGSDRLRPGHRFQPAGRRRTLQNDPAGNSLVLDVTAVDAASWTGDGDRGTWGTSNATANWSDWSPSGSATTLQPRAITSQSSDDTAGTNTAISLPGTVTPSSGAVEQQQPGLRR